MLNFCARVVSGRRKHDNISDVIRSLGWLTAEQLVHYHTASSVLKTIITGAPPYIAGTIGAPAHTFHDHHTRRPTHRTLPRIRTETGRRRLCYRGVKLLNDLLVPSEMYRKCTVSKSTNESCAITRCDLIGAELVDIF